MLFNIEKCKIMHLGHNNRDHTYHMSNINLETVTEERDLGVLQSNDLKSGKHCADVVKAANRTLGMIRRSFEYKSITVVSHLYKALVRSKLEYAIQAWCPHLQKDKDLLEGVQRRATKIVPALRDLPYEDRLKAFGLTTLTERRTRGDMIETYKILTHRENVNPTTFFEVPPNIGTRGHRLKIFKKRSRLDVRKFFYSQRVVEGWNSLPKTVIESTSVNCFKSRYDRHRGAALLPLRPETV